MALEPFAREDWTSIVDVRVPGGTLILVPRDASSTLAHLRVQFGDAMFSKVSADFLRIDGMLAGSWDALARLRQVLVTS